MAKDKEKQKDIAGQITGNVSGTNDIGAEAGVFDKIVNAPTDTAPTTTEAATTEAATTEAAPVGFTRDKIAGGNELIRVPETSKKTATKKENVTILNQAAIDEANNWNKIAAQQNQANQDAFYAQVNKPTDFANVNATDPTNSGWQRTGDHDFGNIHYGFRMGTAKPLALPIQEMKVPDAIKQTDSTTVTDTTEEKALINRISKSGNGSPGGTPKITWTIPGFDYTENNTEMTFSGKAFDKLGNSYSGNMFDWSGGNISKPNEYGSQVFGEAWLQNNFSNGDKVTYKIKNPKTGNIEENGGSLQNGLRRQMKYAILSGGSPFKKGEDFTYDDNSGIMTFTQKGLEKWGVETSTKDGWFAKKVAQPFSYANGVSGFGITNKYLIDANGVNEHNKSELKVAGKGLYNTHFPTFMAGSMYNDLMNGMKTLQ